MTESSSLDQQFRLIFSAGDLKHSSVLGAQKVSRVIQFISVCVIWDWCTNFEFPAKMFIIKDQIWPWIWVLLALPIILIPVTCIYHEALSHFNIICWIRALCGEADAAGHAARAQGRLYDVRRLRGNGVRQSGPGKDGNATFVLNNLNWLWKISLFS